MLTRDPAVFLDTFANLPVNTAQAATARAAFLVAPSGFALAAESARDNPYMRMEQPVDPVRALRQHAALAEALRADIPVVTFPGDAHTPDAVFPNNVYATTHGTLVVGRMRHAVRRREAERQDIRGFFRNVLGYREIDFSGRTDLVAELTGSMVIDHARGIGYCGLSERCDENGARAMHETLGLNLTFCFELAAGEYHTNVMLASLAGRGVMLAADGFGDPAVAAAIAQAYGDHAVKLEPAQKRAYAANAITLSGHRVWLSANAAGSLDTAQRGQLQRMGFVIGTVELDEIEKAGGSLRCCVAEIF